jgi:hypothetical protein
MNSVDPISFEIPSKPIYVVDWKSRSKWVYSASSILKDITSRLQNHDGFFEDPQVPRNMFTNLPLTLSQMISVYTQLTYSGLPFSTALCAFRQVKFSLSLFYIYYALPLKIHSFKNTLQDLSHIDTTERLLDFIGMIHEESGIPMYSASYSFVINKGLDIPLLKLWVRFCESYYLVEMVHSSPDIVLHKQLDIIELAIPLTKRQHEFVSLRNAHIRSVSQTNSVAL